jgi:hypothetical protein
MKKDDIKEILGCIVFCVGGLVCYWLMFAM